MFSLARELKMTVAEIREMSAKELTQWKAFFILELEDQESKNAKEEFRKSVKGRR